LSFNYIHRYGLTSWRKYPYIGYESKCRADSVQKPYATVKSWGIIEPNHENHMELALRYIGPISVGFNGAHPSFLSYSGGIFHTTDCDQTANHALLIVGYGQEEARIDTRNHALDEYDGSSDPKYNNSNETSIKRYWIARNSWGTGWGENGYVRIRRGDGKKGTKGICGIARSPSVALGGVLLKRIDHVVSPKEAYMLNQRDNKMTQQQEFHTYTNNDVDAIDTTLSYHNHAAFDDLISSTSEGNEINMYDSVDESNDSSDYDLSLSDVNPDIEFMDDPRTGILHCLCNKIGFNHTNSWCHRSVAWIDIHRVLVLIMCGIIINLFVIWPLTTDCRRRQRRRRWLMMKKHMQEREDKSKAEQQQQQKQMNETTLSTCPNETTCFVKTTLIEDAARRNENDHIVGSTQNGDHDSIKENSSLLSCTDEQASQTCAYGATCSN
jgi:Papain family cysteine protease